MPLIHKGNQQRIVPERSLSGYRERGWTVEGGEAPNQSDLKADWVAYAEAQGIDTTDMTKDEVIAASDG